MINSCFTLSDICNIQVTLKPLRKIMRSLWKQRTNTPPFSYLLWSKYHFPPSMIYIFISQICHTMHLYRWSNISETLYVYYNLLLYEAVMKIDGWEYIICNLIPQRLTFFFCVAWLIFYQSIKQKAYSIAYSDCQQKKKISLRLPFISSIEYYI